MNFQNDKYTLRSALPSDKEGIRAVFSSEGFEGNLSVQYLRGSDPLSSLEADGERAEVIVLNDNIENKIIAVGAAVVRFEFVNERPAKCAYLTGLKILREYRKKIFFIPKCYAFLLEKISDCEYIYTTILSDNKAASALLEKRHKNMPVYNFLGEYTTFCFHGGKENKTVETDNFEGLDELFSEYFSKRSFTPQDRDIKGFGEKHFYSLRENGKITACCFVGDQRKTKQYKMCSYGGIYKILSRAPTKLLGYPEFPKAGEEIDFGVVSYLYVRGNDPKLCAKILRAAAHRSGRKLLIWGGFENDPLCKALKGVKSVKYKSRVYSVTKEDPKKISFPLGIEAALL